MLKNGVIGLAVLVAVAWGISLFVEDTQITFDEPITVFRVTDFDFTLQDKQAVSIYFGESETKFCETTVHRILVKQGYQTSFKRGYPNESDQENDGISFSCHDEGKYFIVSSKHPSYVYVAISQLDFNAKKAVLLTSFSVFNSENEQTFSMPELSLNITGENFDNLVLQK